MLILIAMQLFTIAIKKICDNVNEGGYKHWQMICCRHWRLRMQPKLPDYSWKKSRRGATPGKSTCPYFLWSSEC